MKLSHEMFQLCPGLKHSIYLTIETLSHKKIPVLLFLQTLFLYLLHRIRVVTETGAL